MQKQPGLSNSVDLCMCLSIAFIEHIHYVRDSFFSQRHWILSFSHTFSSKSAHVGGPRVPPLPPPPMGNLDPPLHTI